MSLGSSKVQGSGWTRNDFGPAQKDYSDSRDPGRIGPCFDSQRETSGLFDLCLGLVSNKRMASTKFAEVPGLAEDGQRDRWPFGPLIGIRRTESDSSPW